MFSWGRPRKPVIWLVWLARIGLRLKCKKVAHAGIPKMLALALMSGRGLIPGRGQGILGTPWTNNFGIPTGATFSHFSRKPTRANQTNQITGFRGLPQLNKLGLGTRGFGLWIVTGCFDTDSSPVCARKCKGSSCRRRGCGTNLKPKAPCPKS